MTILVRCRARHSNNDQMTNSHIEPLPHPYTADGMLNPYTLVKQFAYETASFIVLYLFSLPPLILE